MARAGPAFFIMKTRKPNPVHKKIRPKSKKQLQEYLATYLGLELPTKSVCEEHQSPLDYAWYSFSMDFKKPKPLNADAIVWANRGGGKTKLAAALTLLDCIFKPDCQCRILSGSGDQAGRMYDYIVDYVRSGFEHLTCGRITSTLCSFINKSKIEVLKQSETSVRSHHVNKVRCDEVELFKKRVFEAAKFTTQSTFKIIAAFEVISTMNTSYGLMRQIVKQAEKINTPVFKWCLWDVIEKCEGRICKECPLFIDCQGKAKNADGFYKINDAISQMGRTNRRTWVFEMLCNPKNAAKFSYGITERRY